MRVAVYDQYWPTAGGGEKVAGGIAQVLAADHDVTVLAHEELDLDDLAERLHLDLSGIDVRLIEVSPTSVEEASTDYDLLVNASYHSSAFNRAAHGLYYVHFPHPPMRDIAGVRGVVVRRLRPLFRASEFDVEQVRGFHAEESISRCRVQWSTGQAEMLVRVPAGREVPLRIDLGRFQPHEIGAIPVTVELDGDEVAQLVLTPRTSRLQRGVESVVVPVRGRADGHAQRVCVRSPSFVPEQDLGGGDRRRLGVPIAGVQVGKALRARAGRRFPSLVRRPDSLQWLDSYDRVLANSAYTSEWIERWWGRPSDLLHPPVTLHQPGEKRPIILNVGRFFDAESGHSKKQLELVHAFRRLVEGGLEGWELHLVGGCSRQDRSYLERVRHAAGRLPVRLHVNASGAELAELFGSARIYWHASGLGEDPDRSPDRFEHFGITTVEAMSAGAVPVVIGRAGQREVVVPGRSGYHFRELDQLVELTRSLIADDARWERLSAGAVERARRYGFEAFADRLRAVVDEIRGDGSIEPREG